VTTSTAISTIHETDMLKIVPGDSDPAVLAIW